MEKALFHYTDEKGYKAISSQPVWVFKASKPPGAHPKGAYFTTLGPQTKNLAKRLFIRGAAEKIKYVFSFSGDENLKPIEGGRGAFIFYSEDDYPVDKDRQQLHGLTAEIQEKLP